MSLKLSILLPLFLILGVLISNAQEELIEWPIPISDHVLYRLSIPLDRVNNKPVMIASQDFYRPRGKYSIYHLKTEKFDSIQYIDVKNPFTEDGIWMIGRWKEKAKIISTQKDKFFELPFDSVEYLGYSYFNGKYNSEQNNFHVFHGDNPDKVLTIEMKDSKDAIFMVGDYIAIKYKNNQKDSYIIIYDFKGTEIIKLDIYHLRHLVGNEVIFYGKNYLTNEFVVYNEIGKKIFGIDSLNPPTLSLFENGVIAKYREGETWVFDFQGNKIQGEVKMPTTVDGIYKIIDPINEEGIGLFFEKTGKQIESKYSEVKVNPKHRYIRQTDMIYATNGNSTDYYDYDGKLVYSNSEYAHSWFLQDNYFLVSDDRYCGVINADGDTLIPLTFRAPGFLDVCEGSSVTIDGKTYFHILDRRGFLYVYDDEGKEQFSLTDWNYNSSAKWVGDHLILRSKEETGKYYGLVSVPDGKKKIPFDEYLISNNKYAPKDKNEFVTVEEGNNHSISLLHVSTMQYLIKECDWLYFLDEDHLWVQKDGKEGCIKLK